MSVSIGLLAKTQVVLSDARAAGAVASGSIGVGVADIMGFLQSNVGFVGSICGICLTLVTIKVQWTNGKKAELELRRLQQELGE
jgi:tetrahydromethanopterin S-methyltransferase subunit C